MSVYVKHIMPCFSIPLWKPSQRAESAQIQNLASLNMSAVLTSQFFYVELNVTNCCIITCCRPATHIAGQTC